MEKSEAEQYRQRLLDLRVELERIQESSKNASATVELDQTSVGRLSRMDAMQVQQMAKATERRRQHQIDRIEGALRRISAGDFGYCYVCEGEIEAKRISADPTITRCMKCVDD
ncbi:MAG: TraR/DksA family transcriptional regulator [Pseudohongiellaceae bacterium]